MLFCFNWGDVLDINKLLKGVDCACGKKHTCDIDYVYIEKDAIKHLGEICDQCNNILLVADENTFAAAGEKTEKVLQGKNVKKVIFSGEKLLVPDEKAVSTAEKQLGGIEMIVGIGSGVIQDLCKYISFKNKIPYIIVVTAPSMDGYASDGAAMILGGMKVTVKSGLPRAIIADTQVLKNAPIDMIKSGYGDIIGKFSALNDWKLSQIVTNEYFCQYVYDTTYEQIERTLDLANGILERNEESIKTLMEALVIIGIMMSFAGSSRPASGSEHHLSHFFEITGIIDGTDYLPHGIDVAFSTVITAALREKILGVKFSEKPNRPTEEKRNTKIKEIYKSVANGCIELQQKVGNYACDRAEIYLKKETEIKEVLAEMPSSKEILDMLSLVGLDMEEFNSLYSKEKQENAVLYAKDLKDRYSILWINYDFYGK